VNDTLSRWHIMTRPAARPPPNASALPGVAYYYGSDGALVAVVLRPDAFHDQCINGPAGWVEPCSETCTGIDAGPLLACVGGGGWRPRAFTCMASGRPARALA
jgi:hypothetical protein